MNQSQYEVITCHRRQARENTFTQVGFVEQDKAKPEQIRISFDTQLKTAVNQVINSIDIYF